MTTQEFWRKTATYDEICKKIGKYQLMFWCKTEYDAEVLFEFLNNEKVKWASGAALSTKTYLNSSKTRFEEYPTEIVYFVSRDLRVSYANRSWVALKRYSSMNAYNFVGEVFYCDIPNMEDLI